MTSGPPPQATYGHPRTWPEEELRVATEMGRLVSAGLIPEAAHRVAREGRTEALLALLGRMTAEVTP